MSTLLQNLDNELSKNQLKIVKQPIYVHNFLQCLILSDITSRFPIAIIFVTDNISDKMSYVIFKYVLSLHKISYIWVKFLLFTSISKYK